MPWLIQTQPREPATPSRVMAQPWMFQGTMVFAMLNEFMNTEQYSNWVSNKGISKKVRSLQEAWW